MGEIIDIASKVGTPLALSGLALAFLFFFLMGAVDKGVIKPLSRRSGATFLLRASRYLFVISLTAMFLGFFAYMSPILLPFFYTPSQSTSTEDKMSWYDEALFLRKVFAGATRLPRVSASIRISDLYASTVVQRPTVIEELIEREKPNTAPMTIVVGDYPGFHCEERIFAALVAARSVSRFLHTPISVGIVSFDDGTLDAEEARGNFDRIWDTADYPLLFRHVAEPEFSLFADQVREFYRHVPIENSPGRWDHSTFGYIFAPDGVFINYFNGGSIDLSRPEDTVLLSKIILNNIIQYLPFFIDRSLLVAGDAANSSSHNSLDVRDVKMSGFGVAFDWLALPHAGKSGGAEFAELVHSELTELVPELLERFTPSVDGIEDEIDNFYVAKTCS